MAEVRTGARYASEKQVPRCARNDSQKGKGKSKSKRRSGSLRDDSQKGKGKGKGKSEGNGKYRGLSATHCALRSRLRMVRGNQVRGCWRAREFGAMDAAEAALAVDAAKAARAVDAVGAGVVDVLGAGAVDSRTISSGSKRMTSG